MTLKAKSGRPMSWLPSQVVYGVDCSDTNPDNWKPFGTHVDQEHEKSAQSKRPESKPSPA